MKKYEIPFISPCHSKIKKCQFNCKKPLHEWKHTCVDPITKKPSMTRTQIILNSEGLLYCPHCNVSNQIKFTKLYCIASTLDEGYHFEINDKGDAKYFFAEAIKQYAKGDQEIELDFLKHYIKEIFRQYPMGFE